jgi:RNA recognition motif-containing protein
LSDDGTKIRRAQPYVAVDAKELAARTVYVEPVADDASIDSIQARFAPHGAVANVSLPRGRGFGFVEFEARESAQKAVAALDGVDGVAVLTKGEWERIDRRWKDLSRSPAVAQARRRRRNVAEAAAPKLGGSKIRVGSFAGKGGKK